MHTSLFIEKNELICHECKKEVSISCLKNAEYIGMRKEFEAMIAKLNK